MRWSKSTRRKGTSSLMFGSQCNFHLVVFTLPSRCSLPSAPEMTGQHLWMCNTWRAGCWLPEIATLTCCLRNAAVRLHGMLRNINVCIICKRNQRNTALTIAPTKLCRKQSEKPDHDSKGADASLLSGKLYSWSKLSHRTPNPCECMLKYRTCTCL